MSCPVQDTIGLGSDIPSSSTAVVSRNDLYIQHTNVNFVAVFVPLLAIHLLVLFVPQYSHHSTTLWDDLVRLRLPIVSQDVVAPCAVLLVLGITHGDVMGFLGWIVGKAQPLALRRAF